MSIECNAFPDTEKMNPDSPATQPPGRLRSSLPPLLVSTVVICVYLAVLTPWFLYDVRPLSEQTRCQNNLKQIALALLNYHDVCRQWPAAITYADDGTPMHSWRVALTIFICDNALYDDYNFRHAWNSPANQRLTDEVPEVPASSVDQKYHGIVFDADYFLFRCPGAPRSQNRMIANYVMLIDDRPGKPNGPPHLPGSRPSNFHDGSTVIIIEIADSDIHWMEPRDVLLSELSMKINDRSKRSLSSYHGGACVQHADGLVELLDDATTEERLRELLTQ